MFTKLKSYIYIFVRAQVFPWYLSCFLVSWNLLIAVKWRSRWNQAEGRTAVRQESVSIQVWAFRSRYLGCIALGAGTHATSLYFLIITCFSFLHGQLCSSAWSASLSQGTGDIVYSSLKVGIFDCIGNHSVFYWMIWLFCTIHWLFLCDVNSATSFSVGSSAHL